MITADMWTESHVEEHIKKCEKYMLAENTETLIDVYKMTCETYFSEKNV